VDRVVSLVTADRRHTSALTSANPPFKSSRVAGLDLMEGPPHRRVRRHEPEQRCSDRKYSMSAQLLAAASDHRQLLDEHLAPVVERGALSWGGMRDEREITEPNRSAKEQRAWSPTCATTPLPPGSTITERALVVSISEVPFLLGSCCLGRQSVFPARRAFSRIRRRSKLTRSRERSRLAQLTLHHSDQSSGSN